MSNLNQKCFSHDDIVSISENNRVVDIPFSELMERYCDGYDYYEKEHPDYFYVNWHTSNEELFIHSIVDTEDNILWEDHDKDWSSNDENLLSNLLMWGELEETFI